MKGSKLARKVKYFRERVAAAHTVAYFGQSNFRRIRLAHQASTLAISLFGQSHFRRQRGARAARKVRNYRHCVKNAEKVALFGQKNFRSRKARRIYVRYIAALKVARFGQSHVLRKKSSTAYRRRVGIRFINLYATVIQAWYRGVRGRDEVRGND